MEKIKLKKISILLLCLCMLVLLFTACGTDNPSEQELADPAALSENNEKDALNSNAAPTETEVGVASLQDAAAPTANDNAAAATAKASTSTASAKATSSSQSKTETDKLSCTFSINCSTILDHIDDFDTSKEDFLPEDGVIYAAKEVEFEEGETVFDVLLRETKANKIHMEFSKTPIYKSNYIEGLNNLYEFDCGSLSGWMYCVNGAFPNYGCSGYKLKDGDTVQWLYTCELGRDIGAPEWKEVAPPSE